MDKKAWTVLDGEVLYLDRNANGDLTDANEKIAAAPTPEELAKLPIPPAKGRLIFDVGDLVHADGNSSYRSVWVIKEPGDLSIGMDAKGYRMMATARHLAESREHAPILYFDGL